MELLERHRKAFLFSGIGFCVIAIILTISPNAGSNIASNALAGIVVPLQRGVNAATTWVRGHASAIANNQRLITQNRELLAELNRLELENSRLAQAAEENKMLNAALNIQGRYTTLETIGARVIAHDPNVWYRSFRIDRGSNDGIEQGMAVIADGGLAGVIRYVNPDSAQFVSVIDRRFAAAVISTRTEDIGIASGDTRLMPQGYLIMNHIEADAQLIPGDKIMTSPESTLFPSGIPVGEVVSINTNHDGLTRHAIIRPSANLSDLQMVLIVKE